MIAGIAVIRDSVCAHAPTPACGHGFKVVLGELCTGRVMLQTRILGHGPASLGRCSDDEPIWNTQRR